MNTIILALALMVPQEEVKQEPEQPKPPVVMVQAQTRPPVAVKLPDKVMISYLGRPMEVTPFERALLMELSSTRQQIAELRRDVQSMRREISSLRAALRRR